MKLFTILFLLTIVSATKVQSGSKNGLYPCKQMEHPRCLKWNNASQSCYVIDCWEYESIEGCVRAGKPWTPAIILQSIPVTGMFGSGFGNVERWDIFGVYIVVVFGLPIFACIVLCCVGMFNKEEGILSNCALVLSYCFGCLWALTVIALWIWGIVIIASKKIDAPWTSANGTKIMCPMV